MLHIAAKHCPAFSCHVVGAFSVALIHFWLGAYAPSADVLALAIVHFSHAVISACSDSTVHRFASLVDGNLNLVCDPNVHRSEGSAHACRSKSSNIVCNATIPP